MTSRGVCVCVFLSVNSHRDVKDPSGSVLSCFCVCSQRQMILTGCVAFARHVGPTRVEAELLPQCWEQVEYTRRWRPKLQNITRLLESINVGSTKHRAVVLSSTSNNISDKSHVGLHLERVHLII